MLSFQISEDKRTFRHYRLLMTGPVDEGWKDGDDPHSSWTADLITHYPDDLETYTRFYSGWESYAEFVAKATAIGVHVRDILKVPVGQKRPAWDGDAYNDGIRAHEEAFRRAYYAKRHEAIVQRRESIREAKWADRRWRRYGRLKAKREYERWRRGHERREAADVTTLSGGYLKKAVADWRVDLGWEDPKPASEGDVISLDNRRKSS
jgi:hypothetical protein